MTAMQPERPDVALVIPVWNDPAGLERLLCRARSLDCFRQIIVIDDGSDIAVPAAKDITLIRHERSRGVGLRATPGFGRWIQAIWSIAIPMTCRRLKCPHFLLILRKPEALIFAFSNTLTANGWRKDYGASPIGMRPCGSRRAAVVAH